MIKSEFYSHCGFAVRIRFLVSCDKMTLPDNIDNTKSTPAGVLFIYAIQLSATATAITAVTASAARNKNEGDDNDPKNVVVVKKIAKAVHKVLLYNKIKLIFFS